MRSLNKEKFLTLSKISKTDSLWSCNNLIGYQYLEYWKMEVLLLTSSIGNKTTKELYSICELPHQNRGGAQFDLQ